MSANDYLIEELVEKYGRDRTSLMPFSRELSKTRITFQTRT